MQTLVGIGGWEHDVLDDCLYPQGIGGSLDRLSYYARFFDTVEVRSPFWDGTLSAADARAWAGAVAANRRFRFLVKLHSSFTHAREIRPHLARTVRGLLQELARQDRLGALLVQFPYAFTNTSTHRFYLGTLGETFRGFPVHVELRHSSWQRTGLADILTEVSVAPVHSDFPKIRQFMGFITGRSGSAAYMRLHGRNEKGWLVNAWDARYDYLYNGKEIREIRRRVEALEEKSEQLFVIFNNTTGGKAVANALQLRSALHAGNPLDLPAKTVRAFPFLETIGSSSPLELPLFTEEQYREAM